MYNSNYIQYIFKQSSGKLWNLFFDEKSGICYSNLNKRNSWTEPIPIHKNLHNFFYADMDFEDCIHFIFQTSQGSIMYSTLDNGISKSYPVLGSKIPQCYNKHLCLLPLKPNTHFLYTLKHNNSAILAHQIFTNGSTSTPKVIDYVTESEHPYSAAHDKAGNIYAFYQSSDGKHLQIGYKKYTSAQKLWSDFTPITKYNGDTEYPRIIIDNTNIIHLCYQRRSSKQFELVYQQKVPDKNLWSNEIVIHNSIYDFDNAALLSIGNRILIYWVREDIIYHSFSDDNGSTWSKAARYNFPAGRQLMCMSYKSNLVNETSKVIAPKIPGSFINGYKLAFYQESQAQESEMPAEELRFMILDGIKLLKGSVEELKESDNNISDNITKLTAFQQNFEKEMVKYSVKLNMLENELNQLKQLHGKTENNYNEAINDLKSRLNQTTQVYNENKSEKSSAVENINTSPEVNIVVQKTGNVPQTSESMRHKRVFRLRKL